MSDKLGNVDLRSNYEALSNTTKQTVESEVRRLLDESYTRSKKLLTEKRKELDLLAKALIEYETLDRVECQKGMHSLYLLVLLMSLVFLYYNGSTFFTLKLGLQANLIKVIKGEALPGRIKVPYGPIKVPVSLSPPPPPSIPGSKGDSEPVDQPGVTQAKERKE